MFTHRPVMKTALRNTRYSTCCMEPVAMRMPGQIWVVPLRMMDNLIAQGKAKPMIVVMTNGNANKAGAQNEVPPVVTQGGQGVAGNQHLAGKFEQHLVKDVIPFMEKNSPYSYRER